MSKKSAQDASQCALNVTHWANIWSSLFVMYMTDKFHFYEDSMLCLPLLHPSLQLRRLLGTVQGHH